MTQVTLLSAAVAAICVDDDWMINLNGESVRLHDMSKEGLRHLEWLFSGVEGSHELINALGGESDVREIRPTPIPIMPVKTETDSDYLERRFSQGRFDGNINWTTHPRYPVVKWVVASDEKAMVVRLANAGRVEFIALEPVIGSDEENVAYQVTINDADCRLPRWSCNLDDRTEEEAIILVLKAASLY